MIAAIAGFITVCVITAIYACVAAGHHDDREDYRRCRGLDHLP